jgi:3-oxoacyl-[acyl-carrier protein] reductase
LQKITRMAHLEHIPHQSSQPSNVLVFGGSGIIGRAIALEFGKQGWSVGVHYHRNRSPAEEIAVAITTAGGDARYYQADVGDLLQIEKVFQSFVQDYGSLNLLVWAVGVAPAKLLTKTTPEEWAHTLQTNLTGGFHVLRAAGPIFERQLDGAVIIVGSLSGEQGMTGQAAYAASKAGLIGLMRTTAQEWAGWNIRVNAIFPGWHASPLSASGMDSALTHHTHLLNRTPSLNHMALNVFHLATTQDISGQIWNLDSRIW